MTGPATDSTRHGKKWSRLQKSQDTKNKNSNLLNTKIYFDKDYD